MINNVPNMTILSYIGILTDELACDDVIIHEDSDDTDESEESDDDTREIPRFSKKDVQQFCKIVGLACLQILRGPCPISGACAELIAAAEREQWVLIVKCSCVLSDNC